jgi:hypothetical protein
MRNIYRLVLVSWLVPCPPLQALAMFLLTFWLAARWANARF